MPQQYMYIVASTQSKDVQWILYTIGSPYTVAPYMGTCRGHLYTDQNFAVQLGP